MVKIAEITNSHCGQFWLKLAVFRIFDLLKKLFYKFQNQKKIPDHPEGTAVLNQKLI